MPYRQPHVRYSRALPTLLFTTLFVALPAVSQDVLTYHNNNSRNGFDNKETTLTLSNVNSTTFGKLFTVAADGLVDAEPLYVSSVSISGVTHNLLIVATEHGYRLCLRRRHRHEPLASHHSQVRGNHIRQAQLFSG